MMVDDNVEKFISIFSLHPNSSTINWEHQANYAFPPLVHRPPRSETVQFAEEILQRTPPFAIIEHASPSSSSIHLSKRTTMNRRIDLDLRSRFRFETIAP